MSHLVRKPNNVVSEQVRHKSGYTVTETLNFGFEKKRKCTIYVAKTKVLISFVVTAKLICIFSSPEPSGSQGELIVYPCSVVRPSVVRPSVCRPQFSKIFSSETAWPIKAKFYMKHLWEGGTNVYINNPGHMTKMAAMPIYGKNPSKIFFSGTTGPISTKLGMKH